MTARRDWSRAECTRDPIFLYQTRERRERKNPWDDEAQLFGPWRTPESVWLSRAEGEAWGRSNEHNYPAGCWRVFCVCADGELASVLSEHVGPAP